jgi:hypothetical protein
MAKSILTASQITQHALGILEKETYAPTPYCLVQVTLKDGSTQEIIMHMKTGSLYPITEDIKKHGALTLTNDESGIHVPASEIKLITVMKVTKEQP